MVSQNFWEKLYAQSWIEKLKNIKKKGQRTSFKISLAQYEEALLFFKKEKASLLTMAATDERPLNGNFSVYTVFYLPKSKELVEIQIDMGAQISFPSATPIFASAHWLEREMKDMLGIIPEGHPDLRRLAVHPDWPEDVFPLRKDFDPNTQVPRVEGVMDFCKVDGKGLHQIPVGPIHAGVIEPGHFRFYAFGEDVINLQTQLFYTHRGVEKLAEGRHFQEALLIAERICAVCNVSHTVAYAQAVESIAEVEIPLKAKILRTILLEMERLYNHVGDMGNMCAGIGFALGISRGAILKEKIMRKNRELFGHRYLRGTVTVGGVKKELVDPHFLSWLKDIELEMKNLTDIILSSNGVLERMQTTGILRRDDAIDLGAVGPAARASGVDRDLRRDLPYAAYGEFTFQVPVQKEGDVYCRLVQRIEEARETLNLLEQAFTLLPQKGESSVEVKAIPPYKTALGWAESARGADVHWLMSGKDNTIYRYSVRSASHCNWPVLPLCLPGNIVPDFPLINKSFELCYACLDR